jgi:ABC-2 type transport system ATP-binding protein
VIELERVSRRFGRVAALTSVSFQVGRGEIVGFLGENGAGKTTTLRILAGVLAADRGRVQVNGVDVAEEPRRARAQIGLLAENAPVYPEMRVRDYLAHRAVLKDVPAGERSRRVGEAIARFGLAEVAARRAGQLSRGFRQRLGLADATLARPPVLLLDEPQSGLDPNQVRELRQLLRALAPEHTILLSSHALVEVEAVVDRVVVLARGQVVFEGAPAELRARAGDGASLEDAFAALTRGPSA